MEGSSKYPRSVCGPQTNNFQTLEPAALKNYLTLKSRQCHSPGLPSSDPFKSSTLFKSEVQLKTSAPSPHFQSVTARTRFTALHFSPPRGRSATLPPQALLRPRGPRRPPPRFLPPARQLRRLRASRPLPRIPRWLDPTATPYGSATSRFPSELGEGRQE